MQRQHTCAGYVAIALTLTAHLIVVAETPSEWPDVPALLGPMPRLDPITRFIAPIDPWERGGPGWGVEAVDENGVPFCMTNHPLRDPGHRHAEGRVGVVRRRRVRLLPAGQFRCPAVQWTRRDAVP